MYKLLLVTPAFFSLLLSFSIQAESTSYKQALATLNKLIKEKSFIQAYDYADQLTYDFGGEPDFDLLTGFAAYGSEKYQEAVFAFERVVISRPGSFLGRYYLALSYQKVDNLNAAIFELDKLLQRPLTQEQRDKTLALRNLINKRLVNLKRSWFQMVSGGFAYDNNVNNGTDVDTVEIPNLGEIILSDSAKRSGDMSYALSYRAGYQHPITQNHWFKMAFSANHIGYMRHVEYQKQTLGANFSYEQNLLRGKFSVSAFTKPLWLDQDAISGQVESSTSLYRTETGLSTAFNRELGRDVNYRLSANYSVISNEINEQLDLNRIRVAGAYQFKSNLLHTIIGHYSQDELQDTSANFNNKNAWGLTYQLTWPITNNLISNSYILYEQQEYQAQHPIFAKTRDGQLSAFTSQLLFNRSDKLQLKLQFSFQNNDSNIDIYRYDRTEISGHWQYRF